MLPPLRHIALPWAGGRRAAQDFLIAPSGLIICILFLLTGLAAAGDYGLGPDELYQRRTAAANWDYIRGRTDGIKAFLPHDQVYGVAFELPLLLAERALGLADYYDVHRLRLSLTHLFFIVGAFCGYRLAYRLFGNRWLALLFLLLFLLHPRIYGHSFVNSKDLPFLSMFALTLYLLERAFRRDTMAAFLLLGVAVGLLTSLRIMGIMLFAAPLAMRGLDWLWAGAGPGRKHILLTGGLFALAAGLTAYALAPYAWTNPLGYLAGSLALTAQHPNVEFELFQGRRWPSAEVPPHYAGTWFGITTPPPVLLLGFMGLAAVAGLTLRRPGTILRNNGLRFQLLLAAAFLLPLLAAAALGANQYNGWRQSYFLYVPFSLLAAGGLHWLAASRARQRHWPAGIYGLTGLGLGLIGLQMVQIHPLQYSYFNFLVDRATPERLRTQYYMDYWQLSYREGLEHLLARHPGATLTVRGQQRAGLPPAARRRLPAPGGRPADYDLAQQPNPSQEDLAFNAIYRRRLYNNTLLAARPLTAERMTAAAIAAYREIYRQALAGEPIIHADYAVYLDGRRLVFAREDCPAAGPDAWFGARVFPHHWESLPPGLWRRGSYVPLGNNGVRLGGLCLAVLRLPDYAQGDLILTQRNVGNFHPSGLPLWSELYSLSRPGLKELLAEYRRKEPPPTANAFAVFLDQAAGRNRLLYAKGDCTQAEYETRVTLHIYPVDTADLPAGRRAGGFDNRDFLPDFYGGRPGGECVAIVPLPAYPIAAIRTGQAGSWEVNLYPPADGDYLRAAYAALADRQPAARGVFDLYLQDSRLVYLRETCAAIDTAAGFFLHIIPAEVADLPAERQAAGFANRDFVFERWGGHFDGKCLAAVPLPDYPILKIRAGQQRPGQGELWAAELAAAP